MDDCLGMYLFSVGTHHKSDTDIYIHTYTSIIREMPHNRQLLRLHVPRFVILIGPGQSVQNSIKDAMNQAGICQSQNLCPSHNPPVIYGRPYVY